MRQAARRAVGIGGATAVAIGAMLALALPASAHVHSDTAGCYNNSAVFKVDLENYNGGKTNTVTITDQGTTIVNAETFKTSYVKTFTDADATVAHTFTISVVAGDDKTGSQGFTFKDTQTSPVCETPPPPPPTTTTTTPPPPSSTTTAPPTTTSSSTTPPPATTTAPPTTTTAVVAAATTTPGSGSLPFTGVNTALPLGIAGLLVVAGGGILFWLRFKARRA
jgi:hypothetical protein